MIWARQALSLLVTLAALVLLVRAFRRRRP